MPVSNAHASSQALHATQQTNRRNVRLQDSSESPSVLDAAKAVDNGKLGVKVCPPEHRHAASGNCYHAHGCRCEGCTVTAQNYQERRRKLIAYGRWPGLVEGAAAREHLAQLRKSGMGIRRISELTGLADVHIRQIASGEILRVSERTQAVILALKPGNVADGAFIDATGTKRRLQALCAVGWTWVALADELGIFAANVNRITQHAKVTKRFAAEVAEMYDRVWADTPPCSDAGRARARNRARKAGWVGPLDWDDETIDNPDARPAVTDYEVAVDAMAVELALDGFKPKLNPAERHQAVARLHQLRWSDKKIAAWVGVSDQTVFRDRREIGLAAWDQNDLEDERTAA